MTDFALACWEVMVELAPWLLLGAGIAGALHALLPEGLVRRHLSGRGGVIKAVLMGVPLPLCSCGVIPAGLGLKKDGASDGAAVGFLISTPQTGVDSILVSAAFLGWPFALLKVGAASVTGLVGGWLTDMTGRQSAAAAAEAAAEATTAVRGSAVAHALELLASIWRWVLIGVLVSAAITVFVPQSWLASVSAYGSGLAVLAALAISLPMYVCATASVPIAAALVAAGMPPSAALVFLMAGPATNVATIGAIHRVLGGRALAIYLVTIIAGSAGAGLAFDQLIAHAGTTMAHHHHGHAWWATASAVVLLALFAWLATGDVRRWLAPAPAGPGTLTVAVGGMSCGSCVSKLERTLRDLDGVTAVQVALDPGQAVVEGAVTADTVRAAIVGAGFSVEAA